jgi:hypothetical protein
MQWREEDDPGPFELSSDTESENHSPESKRNFRQKMRDPMKHGASTIAPEISASTKLKEEDHARTFGVHNGYRTIRSGGVTRACCGQMEGCATRRRTPQIISLLRRLQHCGAAVDEHRLARHEVTVR